MADTDIKVIKIFVPGPQGPAPTPANMLAAMQNGTPEQKEAYKAALGLLAMAYQAPNAVAITGGRVGGVSIINGAVSSYGEPFPLFPSPNIRAVHQLRSQYDAAHPYEAHATLGIQRVATSESGKGPSQSENAIFAEVAYYGSGDQEVNTIYGRSHQLGTADNSVMLMHSTHKGIIGGGICFEARQERLNDDGELINAMHLYGPASVSFVDDFGAGLIMENKRGRSLDGLLIDTSDERKFDDDGDLIDTGAAPSFDWVLRYRTNRLDAEQKFGIAGDGAIHQGRASSKIVTRYYPFNHVGGGAERKFNAQGVSLTYLDATTGSFGVAGRLDGQGVNPGVFVWAGRPNPSAIGQGTGIILMDGYNGMPCLSFAIGGQWMTSGPLDKVCNGPV